MEGRITNTGMNYRPKTERLRTEFLFVTSRSGGPGGQHVNKVETKVTLKFDVQRSALLTQEEKDIITQRLARHLTRDGVLMLTVQESRSQHENREKVIEKFDGLLAKAFVKTKTRKATKPSRMAKLKRLQSKKTHGEKKKWRQKP